jgi:hypothetical protein
VIDSPTARGRIVAAKLAHIQPNPDEVIDHAGLTNAAQNEARSHVLGRARGYRRNQYLFVGFPDDTTWRLITGTPPEIARFRYANHREGWVSVSGSSRPVADGARNIIASMRKSLPRNTFLLSILNSEASSYARKFYCHSCVFSIRSVFT